MTQQYLLPCECGQKITVQPRSAGQMVSCNCGRTVEAPMLREMRKLEPASNTIATDADASRRPTAQVSPARVVFVIGLLGLVLSLLISGLLFLGRQQLDLGPTEEQLAQRDRDFIDAMNLEQLWSAWRTLRSEGLGDQMPSDALIGRYQYRQMGQTLTKSLLAAAAFAAICAASAAFSRSRPTRP